MTKKIELTQNLLKDLLHYDPDTGVFTWRTSRGTVKSGSVAGGVNTEGYITIQINRVRHKAHRLAWLYMTGAWPSHCIDHIDGNRCRNVFSNLRVATISENSQNTRKARINNSSGFLGVCLNKLSGKFIASITLNKKQRYIGEYETAVEAHQEYLKAKREIHPYGTI